MSTDQGTIGKTKGGLEEEALKRQVIKNKAEPKLETKKRKGHPAGLGGWAGLLKAVNNVAWAEEHEPGTRHLLAVRMGQ